LWMHALGLSVLSGVVVSDWSNASAKAVHRFSKRGGFSNLLLRIDKRHERWTRRRGGYLLALAEVPATIEELRNDGMIAVLLEPVSPYADQYSLAGVTVPDQEKLIVEVVGPGFDASDILRNDLQPHERWEASMELSFHTKPAAASVATRSRLASANQYRESVQQRLAKIGARAQNPAFPDAVLRAQDQNYARLIETGTNYLKSNRQTTLLKHANHYEPIPPKYILAFAGHIQKLLTGLSAYGIHLGPSSFAASVIPKRGLVFWDFFPARKEEVAALYRYRKQSSPANIR
jgi:hypothetical protein